MVYDKVEDGQNAGYSSKPKYPPFYIYDLPPEIGHNLIKYAKLHTGGKVWLALKMLLEKAEREDLEKIVKKLNEIDGRLKKIEDAHKKSGGIPTWGGGK